MNGTIDGSRTDIPVGNWIDRLMPAASRPYLRLARLDRPIGTWLLLLPCWWSISMAAPAGAWPDWRLMALFGVGAMIMRAAGCTVNDLADRNFDGRVARTATRPIPSGDVKVWQAFAFLGFLLFLGLMILLQLNSFAIALGIGSLALVFTYPFAKRFTYWPQAVLGLTFNWGALLGWAAVHGELAWPPVVLYVSGLFWTLGYDTIYGHQDKDDDLLIGLKSAAIYLGDKTPHAVAVFYTLVTAGIATAGTLAGLGWAFYAGLAVAAAHLAWQVVTMKVDAPADCLTKFKANRYFGWMVLAAIIAGQLTAA